MLSVLPFIKAVPKYSICSGGKAIISSIVELYLSYIQICCTVSPKKAGNSIVSLKLKIAFWPVGENALSPA